MARPSRLAVYQQLQAQVNELHERLGGLPSPVEAQDVWKTIWFQEAHHSTAIEGNTLVLKQVEALLAEGRAVGNKELREYLEVRGYATAADWVYEQASATETANQGFLTLREVRHIHNLALTPVWEVAPHPAASKRESPGSFREHEIAAFPDGMTPPSWVFVAAEIKDWVHQTRALDHRELDFPEQLARVHQQFERIHPFLDGNGRTGRLLLNLILVRSGFPPAVILKSDRTSYLRLLRRADQGDYAGLGEFVARAVLRSLFRFVIPSVAGPTRLVPLVSLESKDLSAATLRTAATRGRLRAIKGDDGHWQSTRAWVDQYLLSRYKR